MRYNDNMMNQMKLTRISNNVTVLALPEGVEVLFSYDTPIAAFVPGQGYMITSTKYSKTTTKHGNAWGSKVKTIVPQSMLDQLMSVKQ